MVRRPAGRRGLAPSKPSSAQIELVDEDVDHPNRVVLGDVVVQALGQQRDLASVLALDESLHVAARSVALPQFRRSARAIKAFSHSLSLRPTFAVDLEVRPRSLLSPGGASIEAAKSRSADASETLTGGESNPWRVGNLRLNRGERET